MELHQQHYLDKRTGDLHLSLDGKWSLTYTDVALDEHEWQNLDWKYSVSVPSSLYFQLYEAGVLPHPYMSDNSKQYHWVDEKVWYYKKTFTLDVSDDLVADLSCDGLAYYSRVQINGQFIGEHEGMFGGPVVDASQYLNYSGENEIIIEIKACNFGKKDSYDFWNVEGHNREIAPWDTIRDPICSNGDFIVVGPIRSIRIEFLNKLHLARPHVTTCFANNDKATLSFECEIINTKYIDEWHRWYDDDTSSMFYTNAQSPGSVKFYSNPEVAITVSLVDKQTGDTVWSKSEDVCLIDYEGSLIKERFREAQFYQAQIELDNPKLWYPQGLGDPNLYRASVSMSKDGCVLDSLSFDVGVRTFTSSSSIAPKTRTNWGKYHFCINGKQFFLKGMNWMPIDFLLAIDDNELRWCLELARAQGIQLLRVWNGGGMPESDLFYQLCDELGMLVWQDLFVANTANTQNFPHSVLESQTAMNIYRIRNHPSLVIYCGGNELNPYTPNNAASMFTMKNVAEKLDGDKIFFNTTPDGGSIHIYPDMEPTWYRHLYKGTQFIAESGIHSFPCYKTLHDLLPVNESEGKLPSMRNEQFKQDYKGLCNHFTEFNPDRIPRMLSRASQIIDVENTTLAEMCEATQFACYEFYQIMIESMMENYPVTTGLMPWAFKRPWATIAVQMIDGGGRPTAQFYGVKAAYKDVNAILSLDNVSLCPMETISLKGKILARPENMPSGASLRLRIYSPELALHKEYITEASECFDFGSYTLSESYTDKYFYIVLTLEADGNVISRNVYRPKVLSLLADSEEFAKHRSGATPNFVFENGPYLKEQLGAARTEISIVSASAEAISESRVRLALTLKNTGSLPAYPVNITFNNDDVRYYLSDNYFWLEGGESVNIEAVINCTDISTLNICARGWNTDAVTCDVAVK